MVVVFIIMVICFLIFWVTKEKKEHEKAVAEYRSSERYWLKDTYDTHPSDISPAMVNLIINEGSVTSGMLFLTLFYLVNRGYYKIEQLDINEKNKIKKDLRLTRNIDILMPREPHLRYVIEMFKDYETNYSFTMIELEEIFYKASKARSFRGKLLLWREEIEKECNDLGIFTEINKNRILTNYYNNEREKWCIYREYLEQHVEWNLQYEGLEEKEMLLVYAVALNIDVTDINSKLLKKENYEEFKSNNCKGIYCKKI